MPKDQQAILTGLLVELQRVRTSDPPGFLRDAAVEALLVQIDRFKNQAQRRTEADTELDVSVPVPLMSGRNHGPQRNSTANK